MRKINKKTDTAKFNKIRPITHNLTQKKQGRIHVAKKYTFTLDERCAKSKSTSTIFYTSIKTNYFFAR